MGGYTVLTTMKNEGAFLLEWVAHYKSLGFDHLVICTNHCADGTDAMVQRLEAMGLARHHATKTFGEKSFQRAAFRQARHYPEVAEADWLWVCDADEFLVVKVGDGSARALVAVASDEAEVISVPWRVFGSGGIDGYSEGPVTEQFVLAQAQARRGMPGAVFAKSLVKHPARVERIGVHGSLAPESLGRPFHREGPGARPVVRAAQHMMIRADYRVAQVNHYALRSRDSFLVKRERGRVNHVGEDMGFDYWQRFDLNEVRCDAIRRYDAAVAEWRARLMQDKGLAALHEAAVGWHKGAVERMQERADMQDLMAAIAAKGQL